MGSIVNANISSEKDKVELKISMNYSEYMMLMGNATNIRIFSEDNENIKTKIRTSGKRGETKYFLIPKDIKNEIKFNSHTTCQVRDMGDKILMLFVVDK